MSVLATATTPTWCSVVWDTRHIWLPHRILQHPQGSSITALHNCPSWHKTHYLYYRCRRTGCESRWDHTGTTEPVGCLFPCSRCGTGPCLCPCSFCSLCSLYHKNVILPLHSPAVQPLTPSCGRQLSLFGAWRGGWGAALLLPSHFQWGGQVGGGAVGACICASSSGPCSWCPGR